MSERRVVLTGIGVVTPIGNDLPTFWQSLQEGRSGISRYQAFDSTNFDCKIAGEVRDFEPAKYFKNPKSAKRTDRFTQFAMAGAKMALEDSGLALDAVDHNRFGVIIGSGIGGIETGADAAQFLLLGADTVQVCTGVMKFGPELVKPLQDDLFAFMEKHKFETLADFKGRSLDFVTTHADLVRRQKARKDAERPDKNGISLASTDPTAA